MLSSLLSVVQLTLTQLVSGVLSSVKEAELVKTVDGLSQEERVAAMKFVYRGMATGQKLHSATQVALSAV